jgi:hypothetical protein
LLVSVFLFRQIFFVFGGALFPLEDASQVRSKSVLARTRL